MADRLELAEADRLEREEADTIGWSGPWPIGWSEPRPIGWSDGGRGTECELRCLRLSVRVSAGFLGRLGFLRLHCVHTAGMYGYVCMYACTAGQ